MTASLREHGRPDRNYDDQRVRTGVHSCQDVQCFVARCAAPLAAHLGLRRLRVLDRRGPYELTFLCLAYDAEGVEHRALIDSLTQAAHEGQWHTCPYGQRWPVALRPWL